MALDNALLALVDLAIVIGVAAWGGGLAVRAGHPRIAGELVAVVLVGPTVLGGQIEGVVGGAPGSGLVNSLFPPPAVDVLTWTGTIGLILYMLLIGMTIDPAPIARRAGTIAVLSLGVLVSTAGLTAIAAPWLESAGGWKATGAGSGAFVLALTAGLAANGVPIVARILEERQLLRTAIGGLVIASAATITTVALIASGIAGHGADSGAAEHLGLVLAAGAVLVALGAVVGRSPRTVLAPHLAVGVLLIITLGAGLAGKSLIGTALVGPLIVGIVVRNTGFSAAFCEQRLGTLVRRGLLPVFLGVAALHTNLRELGPSVIGPALAIIATVIIVKYAAAFGSARLLGFGRSESAAIGALLQCGGIMTIAVSLDMLEAGIITTRLHATLTLAGLVTTVLAGPLLSRSGAAERTPRDAAGPIQRAHRLGRRSRHPSTPDPGSPRHEAAP